MCAMWFVPKDVPGTGNHAGPTFEFNSGSEKTATHSMFPDEQSRNRIKMCADCRVVDLYSEEKPLDIRNLAK